MRAIVLLLVIVLAACSSLTPSGQLETKYAEAARQLGVLPVYPPREEFQVGDVFLVSVEPDNPNSAVTVFLGSSERLRKEAEIFLRSRVVFAKTGVEDKTPTTVVLKSEVAQDDLFSPEISTRADVRELTLPIAAFPSIQTQAGFTASTGLVGALAALGLAGTEETTVTLDFNDVRTYWVPQVIASEHLEEAREIVKKYALSGSSELPRLVKTKEYNEGRKSNERCVKISVVTRAYLTRQIDYTYRDRKILAAGMKFASEENKLSTVAAPPAITINVMKTGTKDTAETQFDETGQLAETVRQAVVLAANTTQGQGGSFSFVDWSARGLTFKQTFQRPVAIGWDGFTFDLPISPQGYGGQPTCPELMS